LKHNHKLSNSADKPPYPSLENVNAFRFIKRLPMTKVYTSCKAFALFLFIPCFLLATNTGFAQGTDCGQVVENFNNTGGSTAGFTGAFMHTTQGTDGLLIEDQILSYVRYSLTSPTYQLPAGQTSLGYGFTLGGTVAVSRITVNVQYVSTTTNRVITVPISPDVMPVYDAATNTSDICGSVPFTSLQGFPGSGRYRIMFEIYPASGTGLATETITLDDYRTNGSVAMIPLPVTFVSFEARRTGNEVLLTWRIAGEKNVNRYEVERSFDGRSFSTIASIASHGKDLYTHSDVLAASTAFYRIKNVDNDGQFKYSAIVRLAGNNSAIVLKAFPLPVQSRLTVEHPTISGRALISVSSADGRIVRTIVPGNGSIQTGIDMSNLQEGMYMIRFDAGDGKVETMKVLKK
jgi:hypothetical protein